MQLTAGHLYEFGPFVLDTNRHLLLLQGRPVPLTPKTYDLLVVLVENSGRVILKDELMKMVWVDSFVEDSNLTQQISAVRKALGEALLQAKSFRLSALTDSLEKAISKCDKLIQKGPEEYTKKKKEKEISEYDLIQLLKQPNYIEELEDHDFSKIKNSEVREKLTSMLAKRPPPTRTTKDRWENDYFAYYRTKYLKKD